MTHTPNPASCDPASFANYDNGLLPVDPALAANLKKGYVALSKALGEAPAKRDKLLPPARVKKMLNIQSFHIGKEQLRCLLDSDFANCKGIRISFGLTRNPEGPNKDGEIRLIVEGAFDARLPDTGTTNHGGVEVDNRLLVSANTTTYIAGAIPGPQPDPPTYPDPPYGNASI